MPHPASLANLRPWNSATAQIAQINSIASRRLNQAKELPDLIADNPSPSLLQAQLHKVRIRIAKTESPAALERLIRIQERLMKQLGQTPEQPKPQTQPAKPLAFLP